MYSAPNLESNFFFQFLPSLLSPLGELAHTQWGMLAVLEWVHGNVNKKWALASSGNGMALELETCTPILPTWLINTCSIETC